MTTLAHDAVMLEVPVDTARLFDGDELYALWIDQVVQRVAETNIAQKRRAEHTMQVSEDDA